MDTMYLEELAKLDKNVKKIVSEVRKANDGLRREYESKETAVLDEFMRDMRTIAGYAKDMACGTHYTGIELDYHYCGHGTYPQLIVMFRSDGSFALSTNAYTHKTYIYDDRYADCPECTTDFGEYCGLRDKCRYGWSWEEDESKRFIALNADKIRNRVYDMVCDVFAKETRLKIETVRKRTDGLLNDIERLGNIG